MAVIFSWALVLTFLFIPTMARSLVLLQPLSIYHFPCDMSFSYQRTGLGVCPEWFCFQFPLFHTGHFQFVSWQNLPLQTFSYFRTEDINSTLESLDQTYTFGSGSRTSFRKSTNGYIGYSFRSPRGTAYRPCLPFPHFCHLQFHCIDHFLLCIVQETSRSSTTKFHSPLREKYSTHYQTVYFDCINYQWIILLLHSLLYVGFFFVIVRFGFCTRYSFCSPGQL